MGLKSEIEADLADALLGELSEALTVFEGSRVTSRPTFSDLANGSDTSSTTTYTGKGVFSEFSSYEIDNNNIMATDTKLICLQSHVTDKPMRDDDINGYKVLSIGKDPLNVSYEIQLRKV